jgi:hypothetical protein
LEDGSRKREKWNGMEEEEEGRANRTGSPGIGDDKGLGEEPNKGGNKQQQQQQNVWGTCWGRLEGRGGETLKSREEEGGSPKLIRLSEEMPMLILVAIKGAISDKWANLINLPMFFAGGRSPIGVWDFLAN